MDLEEMNGLLNVVTPTISFFRVDRRLFKKGDTIKPTGEYVTKLSVDRGNIETLLEESRPENLLSRSEALFIFADLKDAIRFCSKLNNSYIYEVVPESTEGMHRADMNIVEVLYKTTCDRETRIWAQRYWDVECVIGYPCYEYLVTAAKVKRQLFSQGECSSMIQSQQTLYRYIAEKYLR